MQKHYMTTKKGIRIRLPKCICNFLCDIKFPLFNGMESHYKPDN